MTASLDAERLATKLLQRSQGVAAAGGSDSAVLTVLDVLALVPVAMELAAEVTALSGEERLDLATRGMLVAMARLDASAYGSEEEKEQVLRAAETLVPHAATLLYAAYKRRHVFRRSWARRWAKLRTCC